MEVFFISLVNYSQYTIRFKIYIYFKRQNVRKKRSVCTCHRLTRVLTHLLFHPNISFLFIFESLNGASVGRAHALYKCWCGDEYLVEFQGTGCDSLRTMLLYKWFLEKKNHKRLVVKWMYIQNIWDSGKKPLNVSYSTCC